MHVFRFGAPETFFVVHGAGVALALLRYYTVLTNVKFGAILRMRIRRMRQDPTGWAGDVAVWAYEAVVQDVAFLVFAQATGVHRPDTARHLGLIDQPGRAGHHLYHSVDAVDETIARGRVLVAEDAVRARAALARLRILCSVT